MWKEKRSQLRNIYYNNCVARKFQKRKGAIFRESKILALLLAVAVFMMPTASFADIIEGESIVTLGENLYRTNKNKSC